MPEALARRFEEALEGSALARRVRLAADPFFQRRQKDAAALGLAGAPLRGLARALASNGEAARYLAHRPALLERIAALEPGSLARRARDLREQPNVLVEHSGLEDFLDSLRLLRRDEMLWAACAGLGGLAPFEEVSEFLSIVAEVITERALAQAEGGERSLSVVGMGKVAGRGLTYYSDLDLIFVYAGDTSQVVERSRVAQRLISYITTMTGAGVAYAVDSRLRPSGRQGTLVTTLEAFEKYQRQRAAPWEHLALMRARVIAGETRAAQSLLDRVREAVSGRGRAVWAEVAKIRRRVLEQRATASGAISFKTGPGGLMEVEFLATGGLLEQGAARVADSLPSISGMLRGCCPGARVERLLGGYRFLREVEAYTRWLAGRAVEVLRNDRDTLDAVADLVEPGLDPAGLTRRLEQARAPIRDAWRAVVEAETIDALAS
jgi:glutamate-ammonia-ligase adenylyltransferase